MFLYNSLYSLAFHNHILKTYACCQWESKHSFPSFLKKYIQYSSFKVIFHSHTTILLVLNKCSNKVSGYNLEPLFPPLFSQYLVHTLLLSVLCWCYKNTVILTIRPRNMSKLLLEKSIWREQKEVNACTCAGVFGEKVSESKRVGTVCNISLDKD